MYDRVHLPDYGMYKGSEVCSSVQKETVCICTKSSIFCIEVFRDTLFNTKATADTCRTITKNTEVENDTLV